jgi:histone H3/H4
MTTDSEGSSNEEDYDLFSDGDKTPILEKEDIFQENNEEEEEEEKEDIFSENNNDDEEEEKEEEEEDPLLLIGNISKKKSKGNGIFNHDLLSPELYIKKKRSRKELENLDKETKEKLGGITSPPPNKKRKLDNKVKIYNPISSISVGIKMTPMKRAIKNMVNKISKEDDYFKGKKFNVSQDANLLLLEYIENKAQKILRLSHVLSGKEKRIGIQLGDLTLAALLTRKPDPFTWTQEDMINLKLSTVKKTIEDLNDIEYMKTEEIANSKNWKSDQIINSCLSYIDKNNKIEDTVDEFLENYKFDDYEDKPRKSAILSGLSEYSKELDIPLKYDPKLLSLESKNDVKLDFEVKKLIQRRKKKNLTKNNKKNNTSKIKEKKPKQSSSKKKPSIIKKPPVVKKNPIIEKSSNKKKSNNKKEVKKEVTRSSNSKKLNNKNIKQERKPKNSKKIIENINGNGNVKSKNNKSSKHISKTNLKNKRRRQSISKKEFDLF